MIKAILFDADGTLWSREHLEPLELVEEGLAVLDALGVPGGGSFQFAICSNQGGVGLRHWLEMIEADGGDVEYGHLPTEEQARREYTAAASMLFGHAVPVYLAFAYQSIRSEQWAPTPEDREGDPAWSHDWRKPNPGMLLQAMADLGVTDPEEVIFVGDRDEDRKAAEAAGIAFNSADNVFKALAAVPTT